MELIMRINGLKLHNVVKNVEQDSIPLNITDIISICKDFNILGWQIQSQVENILEVGIDESIKLGVVKQEALPHIKEFLVKITDNPYFGDAVSQAQECIYLIDQYQEQHKIKSKYN